MIPFLENFASKNLRHLNLKNCGLSFESLKFIFENKDFCSLIDIDIGHNYGVDQFILKLAKTQTLNKLRKISFANSYLNHSSLLELFSSENFSNVTHFDISFNYKIKDEGIILLCEKPFCRSLTHLNVARCGLTMEALKAIAYSKY